MAKTKLTKQDLPKGQLMDVPLADIVPSRTNPRKEFKEEALNDLAASIKSVGIMQPLVVHHDDDDPVCLLISGERRFRAAKLAGLTSVPCMVYSRLSDEIVLEMQITENLQRQDINPMEESDAFQQLIGMGMATAEVIADKLGKSTKYVYDRIILQKVVPEVQQSIRDGKLTITHGKQFARLPFFEQAKIVESVDMDDLTVENLRYEISSMFKLKLEAAVFDITSKTLVKKAGACTTCSKRSGCNLILFDDVQQDDICFDAECWKTKLESHIVLTIDTMKEEGKDIIKISTAWDTKLKDVLTNQKWTETDEDDEDSNLYGIVVEQGQYTTGYKVGQVIKLADNRNQATQEGPRQSFTPVSSASNNSLSEAQPDWELEFARRAITSVWNLEYDALHQNEYNFLLNNVAHKLARLDLEHQIFICKLVGLELAPENTENEFEFYKEQVHAIKATGGFWMSVGGTGELTTLLYILELASDYLDSWTHFDDDTEFSDFQHRAQSVDLKAIAESINTEAGKTIIAIPEPE